MAAWFPACFVVVALALLFPSVSEGRPFVQKRPEDCPELLTGPPKLFGNCTTELTEKEGGTASLSCLLGTDPSESQLRVSKDQNKNIVHIRKNGRDHFDDQNKKFQGRTSISDEAWRRGIPELNISSLELDDAGIYEFYLDGNFKCQIVLRVVKSQEPSEDGEALTSTPAPSEMPQPSTPSDDQRSDKKGMYIGIGISAVVLAAFIGLMLYRRHRCNDDTNMADDNAKAGEVDPCLNGLAQGKVRGCGLAQGKSDAEPPIHMPELHTPVEEEGTSSVPF